MFQEPDPTTPLGRVSLRARRVPAAIRVPLVFVPLAATLACAFADLPPYAFFADVQASLMHGEHYPMISGGLTAILFLVPVGVAIQLLAGLFPDNLPSSMVVVDPLPPNAGPPPAYMQGGPYAQPLYGGPTPPQAPPGQAPYGQAPYGQAPYGQAPHGQASPGQAPYGQASPGQAPYGQASPGQAPYGQASPGQAPYGQASPGQAPYGQASPGQAPRGQAT